MSYVDGFLLPVSKKKLPAYLKMANLAKKVYKDHGVLEYRECVGDDLAIKGVLGFPKVIKTKPTETVVFAWIVYKNRKHRDAVNKKVMSDPRLACMMDMKDPPFDFKRMAMGGFKIAVKI